MVIEKILKQLTPERIGKEIADIQAVKLPPEIQKWVDKYKKVGDRDDFLWKWLRKMFQEFFLPVVSEKFLESLVNNKILMTMFIVQLDDIADKDREEKLLSELLKIPWNEQRQIKTKTFLPEQKKYLLFTKQLWKHLEAQIQKYPNYKQLKDIFQYDMIQVLNTMRYSYCINKKPHLINKTECWLYSPYNMALFIYSGLDLMCTEKFNFKQIASVREIIWEAQKMARIGNWVSTWERELREKDLTSGVLAYAIYLGTISTDELKNKESVEKAITKIKRARIEKTLLGEWNHCYHTIAEIGRKIKNFGTKKYLYRLEKLMLLHLISKGYK